MSKQTSPIVLAALAIPLLALFGPAMQSSRMFAMRDAGHYYLPLFQWCSDEWKAGRIPLWNPQENCGTNVLADATSSVFYPGKLVFALPLDFLLEYKLYVVGHVILAAAGCYWVAQRWGRSSLASGMAAVAYAFGGTVAFQHANVVFLVGAAWLPFGLGAMDALLRRPSLASFAGLSVVLALMVLGGDPQAAYHLMLIAGLYSVVLAFKSEGRAAVSEEGGTAGLPSSGVERFIVRPSLVAASACLAAGLAAVQLLPSIEATRASQRASYDQPRNLYEAIGSLAKEERAAKASTIDSGIFGQPPLGSHHQAVYDFSVGPWRLAEFIWPNIGGRMFPTHRRWFSLIPAEGRIWSPSLYMGLLPLVLGVGACRFRNAPFQVRSLSWVLLIFTLGSLGWYGVGWLVREFYAAGGGDSAALGIGQPVGGVYWLMVVALPQYVYFRYPAKLLIVASLALSQLAAIGWDETWRAPSGRVRRLLLIVGIGSAFAGALAWIFWPSLPFEDAAADASFGPFDSAGARYDVTLAFLHTAAIALAAWWLLGRDRTCGAAIPQAALLLLIAGEIAVANYWLVPTAPADIWRSEPQLSSRIKASTPHRPRVYRGKHWRWRPARFANESSADRLAEAVRWEHQTLYPKHHLASGISLVETYGSIRSVDYDTFLSVAAAHQPPQSDGSRLPHPAVLRALSTEWLVLPSTDKPAFATLHGDERTPENTSLWCMKDTLPRAWIVHEFEQLSPLSPSAGNAEIEERTHYVLFPGGKARDFSRSAVVEAAVNVDQSTNSRSGPTESEADGGKRLSSTEAVHPKAPDPLIAHSDPQRIVVEATLQQGGLLVLADTYAPGWMAYDSNGQALPVLRTNRVLRGVPLTAGQHRIEFRYRPQSFFRGAAISIASWLALISALVFLTLRRRRQRLKSSSSAPV